MNLDQLTEALECHREDFRLLCRNSGGGPRSFGKGETWSALYSWKVPLAAGQPKDERSSGTEAVREPLVGLQAKGHKHLNQGVDDKGETWK